MATTGTIKNVVVINIITRSNDVDRHRYDDDASERDIYAALRSLHPTLEPNVDELASRG